MTENHSDDDQTPGHGSTVTNGDAREMRRMYEQEEMSLREISRQFGISISTVSRSIKRIGGAIREPGLTAAAAAKGRSQGGKMNGSSRIGMRIRTDVPEDSLGGRVRAARVEMKMPQKEFAEALGVHPATISKMETNSRAMPLDVLQKLVEYTGKPAEYFDAPRKNYEPEQSQPLLSTAAQLFLLREAEASVALDRDETHVVGEHRNPYEDVRNPHMTPVIPPSSPDDELVPFAGEMRRRGDVRHTLNQEAEEAEQKAEAAETSTTTHESILCFNGDHNRCKAEWCQCPHHKEKRLTDGGADLEGPQPTPQQEIDNLSANAMSLLVQKLQGKETELTTDRRKQIAADALDRLTAHLGEIEASGTVLVFGTSAQLYTRKDVLNWLRTMQYALRAGDL